MPCLLAGVAFFFPRLVIILLVIFGSWIGTAYQSTLWPLLGFFFMPYTTLAYALAMHNNNNSVSGLYLVIVVIAVLFDLGSWGGGGHSSRTVYVKRRA
jgi:hypothetical protein